MFKSPTSTVLLHNAFRCQSSLLVPTFSRRYCTSQLWSVNDHESHVREFDLIVLIVNVFRPMAVNILSLKYFFCFWINISFMNVFLKILLIGKWERRWRQHIISQHIQITARKIVNKTHGQNQVIISSKSLIDWFVNM